MMSQLRDSCSKLVNSFTLALIRYYRAVLSKCHLIFIKFSLITKLLFCNIFSKYIIKDKDYGGEDFTLNPSISTIKEYHNKAFFVTLRGFTNGMARQWPLFIKVADSKCKEIIEQISLWITPQQYVGKTMQLVSSICTQDDLSFCCLSISLVAWAILLCVACLFKC